MIQPFDVQTADWRAMPEFSAVQRLDCISHSGISDWALYWPGSSDTCVVQIHGHGSTGDQIYTREDVRDLWIPPYRELGLPILTPNLLGNAWMSPVAVRDLQALLQWMRGAHGIKRFLLVSGSMGGTSNLIYAALHPEDVAGVVALCPATDVGAYAAWCRDQERPVLIEIHAAIVAAYGGEPEQNAGIYQTHSALMHADRLTMPVYVSHGDDDAIIPVDEARRLADVMAGRPNFEYDELAGGHHDSPLHEFDLRSWLRRHGGLA